MNEIQTENPPGKKSKFLDPKANAKGLFRIVAIVFVLLAAVWLVIRFTAGEKAANRVTAAVLQRPIELKNSVENMPASSWKAFPLTLPYTGTLTVDAAVMKGNELDIYLVEQNQLENIKAKKQFLHLADFEASKARNFRRSARLNGGTYYLVCFDRTLGLLSSSSSDIKINARLEP